MTCFNQALLPSLERCAHQRFPDSSSRRFSFRGLFRGIPRCDQSVFTVLLVAHCLPLFLSLFSRHGPSIVPRVSLSFAPRLDSTDLPWSVGSMVSRKPILQFWQCCCDEAVTGFVPTSAHSSQGNFLDTENSVLYSFLHSKKIVYQCVSFLIMLPTDPSKYSLQNCHFGFQLSFDYRSQ